MMCTTKLNCCCGSQSKDESDSDSDFANNNNSTNNGGDSDSMSVETFKPKEDVMEVLLKTRAFQTFQKNVFVVIVMFFFL